MFTHCAHKVAAAAALLMISGAVNAAGIDLGNATLLAGPSYYDYVGGVDQTLSHTVDLTKVTVTSTPGEASFAFDPDVADVYGGGLRPNNGLFSIKGYLSGLTFLGNLVAKDGYALSRDQEGYRITGEVSVTDQATVTVSNGGQSPSYTGQGVPSVSNTYTFTADTKLGGSGGVIVAWSGSTPTVSSLASIKITKVEYYVPVVSVPEAGSMSLMSLGLMGLIVACRRQRSSVTACQR